MTKEDILEILKELILNLQNGILGLYYSDITLDATLTSSLGMDSMDVVELSCNIESKLHIKITEHEVENIMMHESVQSIVDFLFTKVQQKQ